MWSQNSQQVSLHAENEQQAQLRAVDAVQRTLSASNVRRVILYSVVLESPPVR